MTERNVEHTDAMDEQRRRAQAGQQMSTADIAGARNRPADGTPQASVQRTAAPAGHGAGDGPAPLLPQNDVQTLRSQWTDIQAGFVDKPRESVESADALVANVMQRLAESFNSERTRLEKQWSGGGDPSTEDLRLALQHYRSFFDRLLSL